MKQGDTKDHMWSDSHVQPVHRDTEQVRGRPAFGEIGRSDGDIRGDRDSSGGDENITKIIVVMIVLKTT